MIKGLLDKLQASVKELEGEESGEGIQQHYQNTLAHITHTKANDSSLYADVGLATLLYRLLCFALCCNEKKTCVVFAFYRKSNVFCLF